MVLLVHGVVQPLKSSASLVEHVAKHLRISSSQIKNVNIVRKSIDARKTRGKRSQKVDIRLVHNVHVELQDSTTERKISAMKGGSVAKMVEFHEPYKPHFHGSDAVLWTKTSKRPIVIGSGPAGLFAAYTLVSSGFKPIIIEMGPRVEQRAKDIMAFWKHNILTPNSNGVFGEGGAGAFSDGKLTTRTSSPYHRFVHETLIEFGAKRNILYESRAHVGTDQLRKIITSFSRDGIAAKGGLFLYNTMLTEIQIDRTFDNTSTESNDDNGSVIGVNLKRIPTARPDDDAEFVAAYRSLVNDGIVETSESSSDIPSRFAIKASDVFLATGHSARDIYTHLHRAGVQMVAKDFAVGFRLQISQKYINNLQYGSDVLHKTLGAAEFTLKYFDNETKRNVYTFCMCPGGVIVNASHGNEEVAVNGMSYSTRASRYANAAFVVTVGGSDFEGYTPRSSEHSSREALTCGPLSGMHFQQYWENKCFEACGGDYSVPAMRVVDFIDAHNNSSMSSAAVDKYIRSLPDHIFMGKLKGTNLHSVLPSNVCTALVNAFQHFSKKVPGIIDDNTLLVGIESRTSAPVRIERKDNTLESVNTHGLYPIGEGAGYAGGIMTACVDGVRAAEAMISKRDGRLLGQWNSSKCSITGDRNGTKHEESVLSSW